MVKQFPSFGEQLFDEDGKLLDPVDIYVNRESSYPEELLKPVVRVWLLPAVTISTVAVNTTLAEKMAMAGLLVLVSIALATWARKRRGKGVQYYQG